MGQFELGLLSNRGLGLVDLNFNVLQSSLYIIEFIKNSSKHQNQIVIGGLRHEDSPLKEGL